MPVISATQAPRRPWAAYFRYGVSSATFQYLSKYAWERVTGWIRRKHRKITWKQLRRRYCGGQVRLYRCRRSPRI